MKGLRDSLVKKVDQVRTMYMYFLDKSVPHSISRWVVTAVLAMIYGFRVFYFLHGFYMVTNVLWFFLNVLFYLFLKPNVTPNVVSSDDGPLLPVKVSDDFKPFIRRIPEFKLWRFVTVAILIALVMTFFPVFDIPAHLGVLIFFWTVLFLGILMHQIVHMIVHKYIPITVGKKKHKHAEQQNPELS